VPVFCNVPLRRTTFDQLSLAFRGTHEWNRLPVEMEEEENMVIDPSKV